MADSSILTEFQPVSSHGDPICINFGEIRRIFCLLYFSFFDVFFEKVDLTLLLRPIPHVEKTRKWILSLLPVHIKSEI